MHIETTLTVLEHECVKPQFTVTVVVMSLEGSTCSVFSSKVYLRATYIHTGLPVLSFKSKVCRHRKLLLSHDITTKVLVK